MIARAEREVYLATNFWMQSEPSRLITNALRELSRKAVATKRTVVVKIIYDRGNAKQVSLFDDPECVRLVAMSARQSRVLSMDTAAKIPE